LQDPISKIARAKWFRGVVEYLLCKRDPEFKPQSSLPPPSLPARQQIKKHLRKVSEKQVTMSQEYAHFGGRLGMKEYIRLGWGYIGQW
jgi:hypothetical protein